MHNVKPVAECFATVQMLYNFFFWDSDSQGVHGEAQQELEPTKLAEELKRLSDTGWACQYSTQWAIKRTLPAILATLVDVSNQTDAHSSTEAKSLSPVQCTVCFAHLYAGGHIQSHKNLI